MRTAVCTGSFDPPTLGHMDISMRAAELFDMVYVAVLTNPNKKPVFTADERCGLLMEAARAEGLNNVCAEAYSGLAVDFARQKGAAAIIRGIRNGSDLEYEVGTMIEIPRAALTADEIAKEADFFCFGTNDLTQMTYGFSRDDAGKFLNAYYDAKIFENDPFAKLDQDGVGKLMKMAIDLGRPVNSSLHVGICGEHGGDPSSVEFCNKLGLDYVSCSPFRVPIARLAAAQAAIAQKNA